MAGWQRRIGYDQQRAYLQEIVPDRNRGGGRRDRAERKHLRKNSESKAPPQQADQSERDGKPWRLTIRCDILRSSAEGGPRRVVDGVRRSRGGDDRNADARWTALSSLSSRRARPVLMLDKTVPNNDPSPSSNQPRRSTGWLIQKAGTMSAVQAAGAGLTFALHVLVARRFGSEVYGLFSHAIALAGLLSMLAPLGWNNAIVRFISQYRDERSWEALTGSWKTCASTTLVVSVAISTTLLGVAFTLEGKPELRISLVLASTLVPLMAGLEVTRRALQALSRFAASLVPEQVILPLIAVAAALSVPVATGWRLLLPLYSVAAFFAFASSRLQLARAFPVEAQHAKPAFRRREWHATALPMLGSSIGYLVLNRLDVALLGTMVTMSEVGSYSAARRIVMLGSFALASLNSVVAPGLAASYGQGAYGEFERLVRRVRLISCAVGLPAFTLLLVVPDLFLWLFNVSGPEARTVLRVLAVGQIINVATGPVGTAMAMSSHERAQAIICGMAAAFAVVTMPFAVARWGLVGAAAVTASSIALQNILMMIALERVHRDHAKGAVSGA